MLGGLRLIVAVVLLVGPRTAVGEKAQVPPQYRVAEVTVKVYDPRANELKADLSDRSWNQIDASLLVIVEVTGKPGSLASGRAVEVTVAKGKKVVMTQKTAIGVLDAKSGSFFVPVWILGPLCDDISIRARILGQSDASTTRKEVAFRCGE